jgi:hypothetical protein
VRFEGLTAALLKIQDCWDVTWYHWANQTVPNIPKDHGAFIFWVMELQSFETLVPTCQVAGHNLAESLTPLLKN